MSPWALLMLLWSDFTDHLVPNTHVAVSWLALPVVLLFYIIGFAWKRSRPHRAMEIDLDVSDPCRPFFAGLKADSLCYVSRLAENRS